MPNRSRVDSGRRKFFALHAVLLGMSIGSGIAVPAVTFANTTNLPQKATNFLGGNSAATTTQTGRELVIDQSSQRAVLNWKSFNIGRGYGVKFNQPNSNAVAINKIYQIDPSRINGSLTANGHIYLINPNGIIFGDGAQVNAKALVASSLGLKDELLESTNLLDVIENKGLAVFEAGAGLEDFKEIAGQELPDTMGLIAVAPGAELTSEPNGLLLLIGSSVDNQGTLKSPDGQTIMAASNSKVYLAKPGDMESASLIGMLVEVDLDDVPQSVRDSYEAANGIKLGQARNKGSITAERGNVSMMGLAVNQEGSIRATTAVNVGGSIRLVAREVGNSQPTDVDGRNLKVPETLGEVYLGEDSITEVLADLGDSSTAVDATEQMPSRVEVVGKRIEVGDRARITATGGEIEMLATNVYTDGNSTLPNNYTTDKLPGQANEDGEEGVEIIIGDDVVFDVSGSDRSDWLAWLEMHPEDIDLNNPLIFEMARNLVEMKVLGFELRDSPTQRNRDINEEAILDGLDIVFDYRNAPDIADVSAAIAALERTVAERTSTGGSISINSAGVLKTGKNTTFDVRGGSVEYKDGYLNTTKLEADGVLYDISEAPKDIIYDRALNAEDYGAEQQSNFERGYIEGKDAGSVELYGNSFDTAVQGEVLAGVTQGVHQRTPSSSAGGVSRHYSEAARGGSLTLGRMREIYARGDGKSVDLSSIADFSNTLKVIGAQSLDVTAGELFQVNKGQSLSLPAGGNYSFNAPNIEIKDDIYAPASELKMRAKDPIATNRVNRIEVARGVKIDVSGLWVNDTAFSGFQMDPLHISAGSIDFVSKGDLVLGEGSLLSANAGGWVARDGSFTAGKSGDISLAVDYEMSARRMELNGGFEAYGFGGDSSSSLTITAPGVVVEADSSATTGRPENGTNRLILGEGIFKTGGFSEYSLNSTHYGIDVADGAKIHLDPQIMQAFDPTAISHNTRGLPRQLMLQSGGNRLSPATRMKLTHRVNNYSSPDAVIRIGEGAEISTTVTRSDTPADCWSGGSDCSGIFIDSDTSILVEGMLSAPGGNITLKIPKVEANDSLDKFHAEQGIWLGEEAVLDVSGAARTYQLGNSTVGDLYQGGEIGLLAERGFVVAAPGSTLRFAGASAQIDLPGGSQQAAKLREGDTEHAAGGRVTVSSPEGIFLFSSLEAGVPVNNPYSGGELVINLDPGGRSNTGQIVRNYPEVPVEIRVGSQEWSSLGLNGLHQSIADEFHGVALFDPESLTGSGIDSLTLQARTHKTKHLQSLGATLLFQGDVDLFLPQQLILDVQAIASDGGQINLISPYMSLGADNTQFRMDASALPDATAGTGRLNAIAGLLDIVGDLSFQGFGGTGVGSEAPIHLSAIDDIRLRGSLVEKKDNNALDTNMTTIGRIKAATSMTLEAGKAIYATSLSDYRLTLDSGTLTFAGGWYERDPIRLSAGAMLYAEADHINQQGNLLVPFGSLELNGLESLTLGESSLTSVSGAGVEVPFGSIGIEGAWLLEFGEVTKLLETPPEKRMELVSSGTIDVQSGSRIDISGGGSLLASRHIFGPGGSIDILSNAESNGAFAIVPTVGSNYAPVDPVLSRDFAYEIGTQFQVTGAEAVGIPDGWYTVMPARYALLSGAMLITPDKSSGTMLSPGESFTGDDAVTIVTGRFGIRGTASKVHTWSTFRVENGAQFRQRAEYLETDANTFFTEQAAAAEEVTPLLPQDAGYLLFDPGASLNLEGELIAKAPSGKAPMVDITGENIAILDYVDKGENSTTDVLGRIELQVSDLLNFGADSMLIGGRRSVQGNEVLIDVSASKILVEDNDGAGLELKLPELLLTASESIELGADVTLEGLSNGFNQTQVQVVTHDPTDAQDDVSLLAVSGRRLVGFEGFSVGDGRNSTLTVDSEATVAAAGSMALLAGGHVDLEGDLQLGENSSLFIGSSTIAAGEDAGSMSNDALVLDKDRLDSFVGKHLEVRTEKLEIHGNTQFSAASLLLDAAGILAAGNTNDLVQFHIDEVMMLTNSSGSTLESVNPITNSIDISAAEIVIGDGSFDIQGFSSVNMDTGVLVGRSTSGSSTGLMVNGNLNIDADVISAESGVQLDLNSSGDLKLAASDNYDPASTWSVLGGGINLSGKSVELNTKVVLPSGQISIAAVGAEADDNVVLGEQAEILLHGIEVKFDDLVIGTSGGTLEVSAAEGAVLFNNPVINLSGAGDEGHAGELWISAKNGEFSMQGDGAGNSRVVAAAAEGRRQGVFSLVSETLQGGLTALNKLLQSGGFGERRSVRVETGDLNLTQGEIMQAKNVSLVTESGSINIKGIIDARGEQAGRVELLAGNSIDLSSTSKILATPTTASEEGGEVLLEVADGTLKVDGYIDVRGTLESGGNGSLVYESADEYSGKVRMVVPRGADNKMQALESLQGTISGAERIELVGMQSYSASRIDGSWFQSNVHADNNSFMSSGNLSDIATGLGIAGDASYHIMPGVEVTSSGDLRVDQDLDLYQYRYGGEAGLLRLRAANDLLLGGGSSNDPVIIGDGFDSSMGDAFGMPLEQGRLAQNESWAMELVGGADLDSVDRRSTGDEGSVRVLDYTDVRTGTGDMLVAAAEDVVFEGAESKIYTSGVDAGGGSYTAVEGGSADSSSYDSIHLSLYMPGVAFAKDGGDLRLEAGRDILGPVDAFGEPLTEQFANHWLFKFGKDVVSWGVAFDHFAQNIGALGGGNIELTAGQDIKHLSASIPTSGQQVGTFALNGDYTVNFDPELHESKVEVLGGGDLKVTAGRDIVGGNFYVEQGKASIKTGGDLGKSSSAGSTGSGVLISMGDAAFELEAAGDVYVDNVFNPHMVAQAIYQNHFYLGGMIQSSDITRFLSYGDQSSLLINALNGEVRLAADAERIPDLAGGRTSNIPRGESSTNVTNALYPAMLNVVANSGSIELDGAIRLVPRDDGNLLLLAGDSIWGGGIATSSILQSDLDPQDLPDWRTSETDLNSLNTLMSSSSQGHAQVSPYLNNTQSNQIITAEGDIKDIKLILAKQSKIIAGRDIVDIEADIQHSMDASLGDDFTLIQAGRDIRFNFERNRAGQVDIRTPQRGFVISGDGAVQVITGRNLSLGDSRGILTIGNRTEYGDGLGKGTVGNQNLPAEGADINILAGISSQADYAAFIQQYLLDTESQPVRHTINVTIPGDAITQEEVNELKELFSENSDCWIVSTKVGSNSVIIEVERKSELPPLGNGESPSFANVIDYVQSRSGSVEISDEYNYRTLARDYVAQKLRSSSITVEQAVEYLATADDQRQNLDFLMDIFFSELSAGGQRAAAEGSRSFFTRSKLAIKTLFPTAPTADAPELEVDQATGQLTRESVAAVMANSLFQGNVESLFSRISPEDGGTVRLAAPGGDYIGGTVDLLTTEMLVNNVNTEVPVPTGLVVPKDGDLKMMVGQNIIVNSSKIINRSDGGDMVLWSSIGNIDAGRGQRGARVEASPFDVSLPLGTRIPNDSPVISGSGIQNLPSAGGKIGNTYLLTELGVIDAGTAGIQAENITLVASVVQNAQALELGSITSNLSIGGESTPISSPDLGSVGSQAAESALGDPTEDMDETAAGEGGDDAMLAMIDIEVLGYGFNSMPATGAGSEDYEKDECSSDNPEKNKNCGPVGSKSI